MKAGLRRGAGSRLLAGELLPSELVRREEQDVQLVAWAQGGGRGEGVSGSEWDMGLEGEHR